MKHLLSIIALISAVFCMNAQQQSSQSDMAAKLNAKCPMEISEGTVLSSVDYKDNTFIYLYDTTNATYANLVNLGGILHDSLLAEMVSSPDANTQALISICKRDGTKVVRRFKNQEGKTFDIIITPDEF